MADEAEIKEFFTSIEQFNRDRTKQQKDDQGYYDDTFDVGIVAPFHVVRTGSAAQMINNIVGHVEAVKPQVFRQPKKNSEKARESALKVARMLNMWAQAIIPEITESVWNAVLRGEGVFQVEFNPNAYKKIGQDYRYKGEDLPIIVTSPDPLTVFCWPYDILLPARVAKMFGMNTSMVSELYPAWKNPKTYGRAKSVSYRAYWDDTNKYFEASDIPVDGGYQKNVLKFCPFVHFYSGFGKRSADGNPASLAIGKLRKLHGLLKEDCELASRIDSIIGMYANPLYRLQQTRENADTKGLAELQKTVLGPGSNLVVPFGWEAEIYIPKLDLAPIFAHLADVRYRLGLENPPLLSGVSSSSRASGRQEDIEFGHIEKKFRPLIRNLALAIQAVLGRGLQILDTQPQALPITIQGTVIEKGEKVSREEQITKEDIDAYYDCLVELNPEKALEDDRNFMKNRILVNEGRISWKRFLMEGLKLTDWEADEIIAEALAEQAIRDDPFMKAARTQEAIERMGMTRFLKKAQEEEEMGQRLDSEMKEYMSKGGGQTPFRPSEATNPAAMDTARQLLGGEVPVGSRRSPNV